MSVKPVEAHQHPFGPGQLPLSGQLCGTVGGGADHCVPVSCCLSATGIRFLVIHCPLGNWAFLAVGLPVPTAPDPNGIAMLHTHEMRPGWAPSKPRGRRCSCGRLCAADRRLPHHSGCVPTPRFCSHHPGLALTRRHRGFMFFARPAFPSPVAHQMGWGPLGFSPSFTPCCYQQRMSRRGQVLSTDPGYEH
jgi:hypothetical protein